MISSSLRCASARCTSGRDLAVSGDLRTHAAHAAHAPNLAAVQPPQDLDGINRLRAGMFDRPQRPAGRDLCETTEGGLFDHGDRPKALFAIPRSAPGSVSEAMNATALTSTGVRLGGLVREGAPAAWSQHRPSSCPVLVAKTRRDFYDWAKMSAVLRAGQPSSLDE